MNFERPKSQTSRGQLYGSFCIIHAMINREKEGSKPATPKHIELCSSVTACKKLQTITKQEVKTKAPLSKKKNSKWASIQFQASNAKWQGYFITINQGNSKLYVQQKH